MCSSFRIAAALAMFVTCGSPASPGRAAESGCGQNLVDGSTPPPSTAWIYPRQAVRPFYQWENNDGYCGEVNLIQAGMSNGQFMSQYNARRVCGAELSQAGLGQACVTHGNTPNFNAQTLLEPPGTPATGPGVFSSAGQCAANAALNATLFPFQNEATGKAGYKSFMSWVKQEVIAGNQVALGVLRNGGSSAQYDHEVTVIKIGTNHGASDASYYDDDVLYFDDHGVRTLQGSSPGSNPSIPPGAGQDGNGCTPYVYGYSFGDLAQTRSGANGGGAHAYSIVLPANGVISTYVGGSGYAPVQAQNVHNFAISVSGPLDSDGTTLPVSVTIEGPTLTGGVANPEDPVAGYNYENPMIGSSTTGGSCTNQRPPAEQHLRLKVTVSNLTPGTAYNLYQYQIGNVGGHKAGAALPVPTSGFNGNAWMATSKIPFTADHQTYSKVVNASTGPVTVFRCVPASAP